jgi:hypothetical protein
VRDRAAGQPEALNAFTNTIADRLSAKTSNGWTEPPKPTPPSTSSTNSSAKLGKPKGADVAAN